jgi:hypothetical protein
VKISAEISFDSTKEHAGWTNALLRNHEYHEIANSYILSKYID